MDGHIGYGIRPTERGKGYNKINLYLGLKILNKYGIQNALLTADLSNPASWKTIESLGGIKIREFKYYKDKPEEIVVNYNIDVRKAIEKYKECDKYISNSFVC